MPDVVSYFPQRVKEIDKAITGWVFRTCKGIEIEAKRMCPKGATGLLRNSIKTYFQRKGMGKNVFAVTPSGVAMPTTQKAGILAGVVVVGQPYARYVEGYPTVTRRHFVAFAGKPHFQRWGKQRGYDVSKGGLLVWGYNIPFFRGAVNKIKPKAMVDARRLRIVARVGR